MKLYAVNIHQNFAHAMPICNMQASTVNVAYRMQEAKPEFTFTESGAPVVLFQVEGKVRSFACEGRSVAKEVLAMLEETKACRHRIVYNAK